MSTQTALVIIDAQAGLLASANRADDVVAHIQDLVARARTSVVPVIFLQHDGGAGGSLEPGSSGWKIHPKIAPQAEEPVIRKRSSDSFYQTCLQDELTARNVNHLIIAGMKTEYCVDTTSRRAVSLGFDVTLAADAHTTSDSDVLTAEQIVKHHNTTLDDFGNDEHVIVVKLSHDIIL
jgi:nicotinamidase-related amidase